ncbi:MAG: 2-dehydropantoate 2-reductase [Firmicutes bacterium HGW-Firmicutes-7]|nr:MAG: 2-dehydropantoate 2-reductase [Firmicutes bacterium HGW-Firmicutes-7]
MNTLLIGCGAVGIGIATALYDSKVPLDLVARGATKKAIEEKGIKRVGLLNEIVVPAKVVQVYEGIKDIKNKCYDFIIICAKTTHSSKIFEELSRNKNLLSSTSKIIIVQNGLEDEDTYLQYFNKDQVYSARVFIGFIRPELHISEVTVYASGLLMGSLYGYSVDELQPLATAIDQGGIPSKVAPQIGKNIWAKLLYNCALNPLGAILGVSYGKLIENPHSIEVMSKIIEEVYSVMKATENETFWVDADSYKKHFLNKLVPPTAEHKSSMLQDIERKMRTEIDSLSGAIVKLGKKHGVEVPYNEMIVHLIKTIESGY